MQTADSAALLLQCLPSGALAGIDLLSFTTTPKFHGVKHIPPGLHFAFAGTSAVFSERHGIWFLVADDPASGVKQSPSLYITKWDTSTETLLAEQDAAARLRERANLGQIWRTGLTPYRQLSSGGMEGSAEWVALTSFITPRLLQRILVGDQEAHTTARAVTIDEDAWSRWTLSSGSSAPEDIEAIPGLMPSSTVPGPSIPSTDTLQQQLRLQLLHFLPINLKQTFRPGATGRERSEGAQDRSWLLQHLHTLASDSGSGSPLTLEEALLGELQFCFIMLLTLNNFSCLEQWQRLLSVLLTSPAAVPAHPAFFVTALRVLTRQLRQCADADAGGSIDLADESGSVLGPLLRRFRKGVERLDAAARAAASDVLEELDVLEDYLREQHGWAFGGAQGGRHVHTEHNDSSRQPPDQTVEDGLRPARMMTPSSTDDEDDELGEFAPMIVELTAEQAELLGEDGKTVVGGASGLKSRSATGISGLEKLGVDGGVVQKFVVEEEGDSDGEESNEERQLNERDASNHINGDTRQDDDDEEEEEDMQDLEDMDSRY